MEELMVENVARLNNPDDKNVYKKAASLCGWVLLAYMSFTYVFYIGALGVLMVLRALNGDVPGDNEMYFLSVVTIILSFVLTFLLVWGYKYIPLIKEKFTVDKRTTKTVLAGVPMVVFASLASIAICTVTGFLIEQIGFTYDIEELLNTEYTGFGLVVDVAYSCIIAPVVEELIYRGFVLESMQKFGTKSAIIVSALMFAVMHAVFVQMPLAFFTGLVLGAAAVYTKSLVAPIIIHMVYNIFITCAGFIPEENMPLSIVYSCVFLLLAFVGLLCACIKYRKFRPLWKEQGTAKKITRFMLRTSVILFTVINLLIALMFIKRI